jgi:hypothetical protein
VTYYLPLTGTGAAPVYTGSPIPEIPVGQVMPISCQLDSLYAMQVVPAGASGPIGMQVTLRKNYADTSVPQCDVTTQSASCSIGPGLSISAGDILDYAVTVPTTTTTPDYIYQVNIGMHCH